MFVTDLTNNKFKDQTTKNKMTYIKHLRTTLVLFTIAILSSCSLSQMVKMAKDQELTVTPNPLELHGDSVTYEMSAKLPVKMLKKGKVYQLKNVYTFQDRQVEGSTIEFKQEDYPNADTSQPKISETFSLPYEEAMSTGKLYVHGYAVDPRNGKSKAAPALEVAEGLITTSRLVEKSYYSATAPHGYNDQEELIPTKVDFFFSQGSPVLRYSEKRSDRGRYLNAFIAEKNVTRTVTITGTHSPEGQERINSRLSEQRAKAIEKFYRREMRRYDYKGLADSIKFVIKPIIESWEPFKAELASYDGITSAEKSEYTNIINGSGTFEEKEKALRKLPTYKKVFRDVYPKVRTAKTEILTVKVKKSNAEIAALAAKLVAGKVSADTLSNEELSFAASLTPSLNEKAKIFKEAIKKSDSWAAHNNLASVHLAMAAEGNDASANIKAAITQIEIANKKKESAEAYANLATAYLMQGNKDAAYEAIEKAASLNPSNDVNQGINGVRASIEIMKGDYDIALNHLNNAVNTPVNTYNKGLAQVLSKKYSPALATLSNVDTPISHYVAAVAAARNGDEAQVTSHLAKAVAGDADLKAKALKDLEFRKYAESDAFRNILK